MSQEQNELQLPPVLKAPYELLQQAMTEEKYTEAYFLLVSLYEAVLKLIVLSALATLQKQKRRLVDDEGQPTPYLLELMKLLHSPPSFGTWGQVCAFLRKETWTDEIHGNTLKTLLCQVEALLAKEVYGGQHIIELRNFFSHGAPWLLVSKGLREECCKMTTNLKEYLDAFLQKNHALLPRLGVVQTENGLTVLGIEAGDFFHCAENATFFFNYLKTREKDSCWNGLCYTVAH